MRSPSRHLRLPGFAIVLLNAWVLQFQSVEPFTQLIPKTKAYDRSGYNLESFQSKPQKSMDCTCGILPPPMDPPSQFTFPWEVLITHHFRGSSIPYKLCRGSIINDRVILTSASCIVKLGKAQILDEPWRSILYPQTCFAEANDLQVWHTYGGNGIEGKRGMGVSDVYTNPLFLFELAVYNKVDYDFALLTLKTPLVFQKGYGPVPICLPSSETTDTDLVGLGTILARWALSDLKNFTTMEEESAHFRSHIYPRMRCRLNTERKWISDRFLCKLTPNITAKYYTELGGIIMVQNIEQYTQIGVHSWRTYFPMLYNLRPVSLATNVADFMGKIEEYSAKANAQWCSQGWKGLPEKIKEFDASELNEPDEGVHIGNRYAWKGVTSKFRNVRKNCKCGVVNSQAQGRIHGGSATVPYEYGWQVFLLARFSKKSRQLCGGAIINDRVVISAAHCVYQEGATDGVLVRPENLQVYLYRYKGPMERDERSRIANVEAIIPHPDYQGLDFGIVKNDIALIILRRPICFICLRGKVSPLCLPESNEDLDMINRTDARVIGWGRTNVLKPMSHAETLQELYVKIISRKECIEYLLESTPGFVSQLYDDKKLCAGKFRPSWNYKDPAHGDSGGPLFLPAGHGSDALVHVGIASMITMGEAAVANNASKTVTFYTKTQAYVDFIDFYSIVVDASWCSR